MDLWCKIITKEYCKIQVVFQRVNTRMVHVHTSKFYYYQSIVHIL